VAVEVDDAFRSEAQAWLDANVPQTRLPSIETPEGFEAHREWEQALYDAGLAAPQWPEAYGGRGLDPLSSAWFEEAYSRARAPERLNVVGLHICGPTIIEHGTPEQKAAWLPDLLACRAIWSQGFSEPGAGSDLASIRTRADVSDDQIIINGHKIWTSLGKWCDWILMLIRTDATGSKHAGLSLVVVDRHTPGVEVRPIRQLTGEEAFSEVFLTDVVVPRANVVGELNNGWRTAMSLLTHERGPGVGTPIRFERLLEDLWRVAARLGLAGDSYWRCRLGEHAADVQAYRWLWERDLRLRTVGDYPIELACVNKLIWTELDQRMHETGWSMLGEFAELDESAPDYVAPPDWEHGYWYSRAHLIAAGTSEIQRNVIARRGLGLPRGA
jgi:alkylation response protein AidB-like acyl-CoA dehydrogenase